MSVRHLPHQLSRPPLAPHAATSVDAPPLDPPLATRDAVLALLLRQGEATAADLASSLGVSVQAMRRHLRSLEEDALVVDVGQAPETIVRHIIAALRPR